MTAFAEIISNRLRVYSPIVALAFVLTVVAWICVEMQPDECFTTKSYCHIQQLHIVLGACTALLVIMGIFRFQKTSERIVFYSSMAAIAVLGGLAIYIAYSTFWRPCDVPSNIIPKATIKEAVLAHKNIFEINDELMTASFCLDIISSVILLSASASFYFGPL